MINREVLRNNSELIKDCIRKRQKEIDIDALVKLEALTRTTKAQLQDITTQRNQINIRIPKEPSNRNDLIRESNRLKILEIELAPKLRNLIEQFEARISEVPNLLDPDVPEGKSDADNVEIRRYLNITGFEFEPKPHYEIEMVKPFLDFDNARTIHGSRFSILKGPLARLERVLSQFMLDIQTRENGFEEVNTPVIVNDQTLYGTGQLPKFKEDLFQLTDGKYLIPTAEVTLTNLVNNQILNNDNLNLKYTALTQCFRSEVGAAGKDVKGILRQHQFSKIELVAVTKPEESAQMHEFMVDCAEGILKKLKLPFRTMLLCGGDTGFGSTKTYDLEVWMPGETQYREISSVSNCGDFQARRMKARFKRTPESETEFVHTLNGSGLAVGRTLIAVLENYQTKDGNIKIPEVLVPYFGNKTLF